MPILKENLARYPKNWKEIRAAKLEAVNYQCERCGLKDRIIGARDRQGYFWTPDEIAFMDHKENFVRFGAKGPRLFKIVLTIAHLDHTPENNDPKNLRAWCQKCHNTHDNGKRSRNRERRRKIKRGQLPLINV